MFTLKIVNHQESSSYLKSWSSVCVWLSGSDFFKQQLEEMNSEQGNEFKEENNSFKAVMVNTETDEHYWVLGCEFVYITDSSGQTVEMVR